MKNSLVINKVLFIILAIFVFRFSLSSYSVLYTHSSDIFKIEFLFVLLYTIIHQKIPSLKILNNRFVMYGLLAWVAMFSAKYIAIGGDVYSEIWSYAYMIFHIIFFLYAIDIIDKERIDEGVENRCYYANNITRQNVLLGLLCVLTFSVAITSGNDAFENSKIVLKHELIFILAYIFINKSFPNFSGLYKTHSLTFKLIIIWFLVVTISLFGSPYGESLFAGMYRYYQTFFHMMFFVFVYLFLIETNTRGGRYILLMIPLSAVVLSLVFVASWFILDEHYKITHDFDWGHTPPLNSNIRHTGYLVTAAASVAIAFVLHPTTIGKLKVLSFVLLVVSSAFVFWTGGKAATISVIGVLIFLALYLAHVRSLKLSHLALTCVALFLAVYLAELFKIFDWNGIFGQVHRTEKMGVDSVLKARFEVWMSVIESLKGHWLFGLGSEGYYLMPNRIFGVQPHNLFIQFVAEWGLLGGALFFVLMIRVSICIINSFKSKNRVADVVFLSGVAVLIALTAHGLVDGTYYHGQPSYYIALTLAICLSVIEINRRKEVFE